MKKNIKFRQREREFLLSYKKNQSPFVISNFSDKEQAKERQIKSHTIYNVTWSLLNPDRYDKLQTAKDSLVVDEASASNLTKSIAFNYLERSSEWQNRASRRWIFLIFLCFIFILFRGQNNISRVSWNKRKAVEISSCEHEPPLLWSGIYHGI